jgi:hypothetical protein
MPARGGHERAAATISRLPFDDEQKATSSELLQL